MKKGETYKGFRVVSTSVIEDLDIKVVEIVHIATNAKVIQFLDNSQENLFVVSFKTYPPDDTGVPHILEHTVLCGSKKYPVYDPFFSMLKRSNATFANAFTSKLWTAYTASSTIPKDFYNLLDVYLDAIFAPLLQKESFYQEGWRKTLKDGKIGTGGVVYNEMLGYYSNPYAVLEKLSTNILFPGHTYSYDFGGDPKFIPTLKHKDLVAFHKKHYHPSMANFFFYGNMDIKEHLSKIEGKLKECCHPLEPLPRQKRFNRPRYFKTTIASTREDSIISISWLTTNLLDRIGLFTLILVDYILTDNDSSLLTKKIIEGSFATDVISNYDTDTIDVPYMLVFEGVKKDTKTIERVVNDTLLEIDSQNIDSLLDRLEFSLKEIVHNSYPYGLELWFKSIPSYLQGNRLLEYMEISTIVKELREKLNNPNYLKNWVKENLLNNNHRSTVTLSMVVKKQEDIAKTANAREIKEITKINKEIEKYQSQKKDANVESLPKLEIEDIPPEVIDYPITKKNSIYHHQAFTNKIDYVTAIFNVPITNIEDIPYLQLTSYLLPNVGTDGKNYSDTLQLLQDLGKIKCHLNFIHDTKSTYAKFSISAKSLHKNTNKLLKLLKQFTISVDFDKSRITQLTDKLYTSISNNLDRLALDYAIQESCKSFSEKSACRHLATGMPYFLFLKKVEHTKFEAVHNTIFANNLPDIVVVCDKDSYADIEFPTFDGSKKSAIPKTKLLLQAEDKQINLNSLVSHNVLSFGTVNYLSKYSPAIKLSSYLLENQSIHHLVREIGGAYSSGVEYSATNATYTFFSSKDPNVKETYKNFRKSITIALEKPFTNKEMNEAKLSYLNDCNKIASPGLRGIIKYFEMLSGNSLKRKQSFKNSLLNLNAEEVANAIKKELSDKKGVSITYTNLSSS